MATRKSSIGANLVIDRRQFKAALDASKGDAVAFAKSLEAIKAPRSGVLAGEGVGGDNKWANLGGKVAVAKAALEGLGKIKDKLAEPEKVEMEFETALAGLAAVQDGAETLEQQMKALFELGEKPGLGFQQVMEASVGLQAVGQDAAKARDTMEQFGNAVALVGGGKQEFSEVMVSLRQILSTGSVDMTNLKEIASRIPQFLTIAQSLDRSSAPKFVEAAVEKLKQLPRAATTAQEALGNLDDAWKKKYIETSDGALVANVKARVERSIEQLKQGGAHTAAAKLAEWWGTVENAGAQALGGGGRVKLTDLYETAPAEIARRKRAKQEAEDAKKAAEEKAKAEKSAEGLAAQEELTRISNKQLEIEEARADGNEERLAQLEQELRMMTEGKEIMEKTGLEAEVVADHLQRRADHEKEIERLKSITDPHLAKEIKLREEYEKLKQSGQHEKAQSVYQQFADSDMEIARLRSRGKNKQADKLEADRAEKQRVEQLMKEGGMGEKEAKKMAAGERQIQEDADYLSRTGRRKIRGATNAGSYEGLDGYRQSDREMGMVDEWNFDKLDAMKTDKRYRPLKSELDRAAGKPAITPDKFSGMNIKQAEEMVELLRAIRAATEKNLPTVSEQLKPKTSA